MNLAFVLFAVQAGNAVLLDGEPVVMSPGETVFTWDCPELVPMEVVPGDLDGFTADGCAFSGEDGRVLLPARNVFLAVPPGSEAELRVIAEGVERLGPVRIARVDPTPSGSDSYSPAGYDVPSDWGVMVEKGEFRRAGLLRVRLHPAVIRDGILYGAKRLRITVEHPSRSLPAPSGGESGRIFDVLFIGGNTVWESLPRETDDKRLWGLPWYSMKVDTAGIYRVTCSEVPQAEGAPSSTIALFCGRGRDMGDSPWENAYEPRPVPILMEDGGDGTFDQGDSFVFFGRGLSWWESDGNKLPLHFNHRFDDSNRYWLTWGGEDGSRMDVQDGSITGAPGVPGSFLARYHFEQNIEKCREITSLADDWAWIKSSGSSSSWHYFDFDLPEADGGGYLRLNLDAVPSIRHRIRVYLNSSMVCDTVWSGSGTFSPLLKVENFVAGKNTLALEVVRDQDSYTLYFDWFEVFPWLPAFTGDRVHVPMEWWEGEGRHGLKWPDLQDADIFMVGGDTLAVAVSAADSSGFEFEFPDSWLSREFWIVAKDRMMTPSSIEYGTPGRIKGSLSGAKCIYLPADVFEDDIRPLCGREGTVCVTASEVYDEFNGGVRDPGAIRAFIKYVVDNWNPIPLDLVLVGGGTWDPRHFAYSRESFIDVLYIGTTAIVSDDRFAVVGDISIPQMAVSRINVDNASDLQRVVSRSLEYRNGTARGEWQTVVLGAADDERSPLHGSDEVYHTRSVEKLLTDHLPGILRPEKMYMIFYDWNSAWKKPQARLDYIEKWSEGALVSLYLGHGSFDQLADEGLLYLEDLGLLACGPRLPVALFGSCDVGRFQDPFSQCIGQQVTTSPTGGGILGVAATDKTTGPLNESLIAAILDRLFSVRHLSAGTCVLLGKLDAGFSTNNAQYAVFGDGSVPLAYPWETFSVTGESLYTGELNTINGTAPGRGLLLVDAWESCRPDTYYTFRQSVPISYLSLPGRFYSGTSTGEPEFSVDMFVPVDSKTGRLSRTEFVFLDRDGIAVASTYPSILLKGSPGSDSQGPDIELWIEGCRGIPDPSVSGEVMVSAVLSDSSGINLLDNVGRQLVLYVDGSPMEVSRYFEYDRGSSTTGSLSCNIGILEPGTHKLVLRASDGLLNVSEEALEFDVIQSTGFRIFDVFAYPNPCTDGTSVNWHQTSPGEVSISIFTLTGRRVTKFGNIDGVTEYNQYWWDCRDSDGDPVSNGSYIFVVSPQSVPVGTGPTAATGVIVVVR